MTSKIPDSLAHEIANWMESENKGLIRAAAHFGIDRNLIAYHLRRVGRRDSQIGMNCANGCSNPRYRGRVICSDCIANEYHQKMSKAGIETHKRGGRSMQQHEDNKGESWTVIAPLSSWRGWDHSRSCALLKMPILVGVEQ